MENKLCLSVDRFNLLQEISDAQLAIGEVWVCCDGNNAHNKPITEQAIIEAIPTLYNKFLVAGFEYGDFMNHEKDQLILGHFPKENDVRIEEENGKKFLVANVIVSKIYAPWAYEAFLDNNFREVSMEIIIVENEVIDGVEWITSFVFIGVTVLGLRHKAACGGANIQIKKFSSKKFIELANKEYEKFKCSKLRQYKIPEGIKEFSQRGLDLRKENKYKGNPIAFSIAKILASNETIDEDKIMRYSEHLLKNDYSCEETNPPTTKYINHMLCGGGIGREWLLEKMSELNSIKDKGEENCLDSKKFSDLTYGTVSQLATEHISKVHRDAYVVDATDEYVVYSLYDCQMCGYKYYKVNYVVEGNDIILDFESEERVISKWTNLSSDEKTGAMLDMEELKMGEIEEIKEEDFAEDNKVSETEEKMSESEIQEESVEKMTEEVNKEVENFEEEKEEAEEAEEKEEDVEDAESDDKEDSDEKVEEKMSDEATETINKEISEDESENAMMAQAELEEKCFSLEEENNKLKIEIEELKQFKASIEKEKKDNIVLFTMEDIKTKCSAIPQEKFDEWKLEAEKFSLEDLEGWKNFIYAQAFVFSNGETKTDDIVRMGLPFEDSEMKKKKGLWD